MHVRQVFILRILTLVFYFFFFRVDHDVSWVHCCIWVVSSNQAEFLPTFDCFFVKFLFFKRLFLEKLLLISFFFLFFFNFVFSLLDYFSFQFVELLSFSFLLKLRPLDFCNHHLLSKVFNQSLDFVHEIWLQCYSINIITSVTPVPVAIFFNYRKLAIDIRQTRLDSNCNLQITQIYWRQILNMNILCFPSSKQHPNIDSIRIVN